MLEHAIHALPLIPNGLALAVVALLGYLVGRRRPAADDANAPVAQRELERAQAVARQLESIANSVRRNLERHEAKLSRFKERVARLGTEEQRDAWKQLCQEAEEVLRPTLQLASDFARAYDDIRQQSNHLMAFSDVRTDPLTNLRNRRALGEVLEHLLALRQRYGQPFSVVMLDVDHFKQINDHHGHLAGDRVLQAVSRQLQEVSRDTDLVARYGGEEFVVVLPQTALEPAAIFAERVCAVFAHTPLEELSVTVSCGLASALDDDSTDTLLARADQALYAAKRAGRNQAWMHDGDQAKPLPPVAVLAHVAS